MRKTVFQRGREIYLPRNAGMTLFFSDDENKYPLTQKTVLVAGRVFFRISEGNQDGFFLGLPGFGFGQRSLIQLRMVFRPCNICPRKLCYFITNDHIADRQISGLSLPQSFRYFSTRLHMALLGSIFLLFCRYFGLCDNLCRMNLLLMWN